LYDDAHSMTEVTARPSALAVAPRDITPAEIQGLDRLRAALAGAVDRTSPRAISWLWDRMLDAHPDGPAPAGFAESVATALGDLLAVHVPTVRWAVWPGPDGPTLGVASVARPHAPVLPFVDVQDRWRAGSRDWVVGYLDRAAAHLAATTTLPHPRQAPDDAADDGATSVGVGTTTDEAMAEDPGHTTAPEPATDGAMTSEPAPGDAIEPATKDAATERPVASDEPAGAVPPADVSPDNVSPDEPAATTVPDEATAPAPDEPLEAFARSTLDHAMLLLQETGTFDREILVLLVGPAGRRAEVFAGDPVQTLARAYAMVRGSGARRAAVTWVERHPAYLPGAPQRFPAVVVDTWDTGAPGLRVAHRFVDDVLGTDPLGGPLVVGTVPALI
jgi:hypothetical protein